jgi:hypothetical protein
MIRVIRDDPIFEGLPRHPLLCLSESLDSMILNQPRGAVLLASTETCESQIYMYEGKPWYTFQAHIERSWEFSCPEAYLPWKNLFRCWGIAPQLSTTYPRVGSPVAGNLKATRGEPYAEPVAVVPCNYNAPPVGVYESATAQMGNGDPPPAAG